MGTYILFQETYTTKRSYERLHPTGRSLNYSAIPGQWTGRAMGGVDVEGLGVLFGLRLYHIDLRVLMPGASW